MPTTENLRRTVTDRTPFYALAGTADLAAEKIRNVRAKAPERIAAVRSTDPKAVQERVQERVAQQAKETQDKLAELLGTIEVDLKKIREMAQDLALQSVGRAAECAVRARETYDELAERGRGAVKTWRREAAEEVSDIAKVMEPEAASPAEAGAQLEAAPQAEAKAQPGPAPEAKAQPEAKTQPEAAPEAKAQPEAAADAARKPTFRKSAPKRPTTKGTM